MNKYQNDLNSYVTQEWKRARHARTPKLLEVQKFVLKLFHYKLFLIFYFFLSDFESRTEKIRAVFAETINTSRMQQNAKHSNNQINLLVVLGEYWQNALGRWMDSECTVFMLKGKSVCWIDGSITTTLQGIVSRNSACNSILLGHSLR